MNEGFLQEVSLGNPDTQFPWKEKKGMNIKLAEIYDAAGYRELGDRAAACCTWLQYNVAADGRRDLKSGNFCQLRLCPICIGRRAKRAAWKLSKVMNLVEAEHGARFLFLTLTIRNVDGAHLREALDLLTKAWYRLMEQRQIERSISGWFRAIEITRKGKEYHPHLHAILAVEPSYFDGASGLYITQKGWRERWQKAIRCDYDPRVHIEATKGKDGRSASAAASVEAAKYATKSSDYIDPKLPMDEAVRIVTDYTTAMHRKRLTAFGGWMKQAALRLDAEDLDGGDLVHIDDEHVRDDVAELIEEYNWHFGAGDYVLTSRRMNPLKVVKGDA